MYLMFENPARRNRRERVLDEEVVEFPCPDGFVLEVFMPNHFEYSPCNDLGPTR